MTAAIRTTLAILAILGMAALGASPAAAAWYEFSGTLEITQRSGLLGVPPVSVSGAGVAWSGIVGTRSEVRIHEFQYLQGFTGTAQTTPPLASRSNRLEVHGIGDARFAATLSGPPLHGPMPARGVLKQRTTMATAATTLSLPLTHDGQVGWGIGGSYSFPLHPQMQSIRFSPWTAGTAAETGVVNETGLPGTLSAMGFDARTANGLGQVQLVTPVRIVGSNGNPDQAFLTTLTLEFVPEPVRALGLAVGAVALIALGRRARSTAGAA